MLFHQRHRFTFRVKTNTGKMWGNLSRHHSQGPRELSQARSKLRIISRRKTSSRTPMRTPTWPRDIASVSLKPSRNRSFHPEKLCRATFYWAIHRVGSHRATEKMPPATPTFISPRRRRRRWNCESERCWDLRPRGFNELGKTWVFVRARNQRKVAFYRKRRRRPQ